MSGHEIADDLYALKHWLETFPEFQVSKNGDSDNHDKDYDSKWKDDFQRSLATMYVLEEISESMSPLPIDSKYKKQATKEERKFKNSNEIWKYMLSDLFPNAVNVYESSSDIVSTRSKIALLSEALCHVMTKNCKKKEIYIRRILNMDDDDGTVQRTLMKIVENGLDRVKRQQEEQESEMKNENTSTVNNYEDYNTNHKKATAATSSNQQQNQEIHFPSSVRHSVQSNTKKRKLSLESYQNDLDCSFNSEISDAIFSPPTKHQRQRRTSLENNNKVQNLENELSQFRIRESDLIEQLETLRSKQRGMQLEYETKSMERERQITEQYKKDLESLQTQLDQHRNAESELEETKHKVALLLDEVDCLKHCEQKLGEAEHRLRNLRDRLEDMGDVKSALVKEEEAHAKAIDEIIKLENEINALQPLRRQLEDYKTRATDAEVKLIEYQEKLTQMNDEYDIMKGVNQELKKLATCRKENADSMKQVMMLRQEDLFSNDGTHGIGEGMTELNPEVQEELLRLRNENSRLREFVDKRSEDSVEKLEGNLDDTQRLNAKLKSEFLNTKARLDVTLESLEQSVLREESLKNDVKNLKEDVRNTEKKLKDETEKRIADKEAATKELEACKESLLHQHKIELVKTNESWNEKLQIEKENTRKKMKHAEEEKAAMSKQWFETLSEEQANFEDRLETAAIEYEQMEQKWKTTVEMERQTSEEKLREAADEYRKLNIKWEENMMKEKEIFKATIEQMKDKQREEETKWKRALEEEVNDKEMKLEDANVKYKEMEETFANTMEQHKSQTTQEFETMKLDYEERMKGLKSEEKQKREDIIRKGTKMLNEEQNKNEVLTKEYNEFKQVYKKNEESAKAKLAALKNKLTTERNKSSDLEGQNSILEEEKNKLQREKVKLQEENDRFRRLMANSHTDGTASQSDLNKLTKEYDLILKENKKLKIEIANLKNGINDSNSLFYSSHVKPSTETNLFNSTTNASTLSHVRDEYDHIVQKLNDEKREFLRQRMTAETELASMRQKYNSAEEELNMARNEIISLNLVRERYEAIVNNSNNKSLLTSFKKRPDSAIKSRAPSTNISNAGRALNPTKIIFNIPENEPSALAGQINKENIEYDINRSNTSFTRSNHVNLSKNNTPFTRLNLSNMNTTGLHREAMSGSSKTNGKDLVQRNTNDRRQSTFVDLAKISQSSDRNGHI